MEVQAMKRNYRKEYTNYHGKPKQKANRNSRNKARRKMVNSGRIKKNDTRDVHHKDGNPRNNSAKNLSAKSKSKNRSRK